MSTSSFLLLVASLAAGEAKAELKLGYVDLQKALGEVGEGREAKARLKQEQERNRAELEGERSHLANDKVVLDKQGAMMSEEVRTQKLAEWQRRMLDTAQKAERKQTELADRERTELKKIFDKMDPIITAIAQRDGLAMVFEKTDSGLVYAPSSMDLTPELVKTYNERFPGKGSEQSKGAKAEAGKK